MGKEIRFNPQNLRVILAFLLVFGLGYLTGRSDFHVANPGTSSNGSSVINQENGKPQTVNFGLFWDAWKAVNENYVKQPDDQERVYGAISGMVSGLGDPFSVFMKPAENQRFNEDINGNFEGIGAELELKDGLVTVVAPLADSPAERAGIVAGDIIIKINGEDVPTSLEEAVKKIRGQKGTEVKLTVVRDGQPREIAITRDVVEVKSVLYRKKDTVGIIKINQFTANTTDLLDKALAQAKSDNVKGLVVDVRNNPGGLLNVAVEVSSRFIEPGTVVVTRDRAKHEEEDRTVAVRSRITLPTVVLANKGSASASEIFAGAMQDYNRAKVVGETTFGKGSVQTIVPLKDGSAIRITTAEWLTPKKREINKQGIKPDIEVKLSEDDAKAKRDPQLDKALELLK